MMSMATTRRDSARSWITGAHDALLPAKPCSNTSGGPLPRSSMWKSMPPTRTMLISCTCTNRDTSLQLVGDRGPDRPMLHYVVVAIGYQLDNRQTPAPHSTTEFSAKRVPVPGSCVRCPEEPGRRRNIETSGRAEE